MPPQTETPPIPPKPTAAPVAPTEPAPVATSPTSPVSSPPLPHNGSPAAQVVWQWLTYVLWAWALGALSILLSGTLSYFISDRYDDYNFLIYAMATLLVLLPLAFVADRIYSKKEPAQKHGFAAVVMALNAVVIFIIALGGIITAVISLFSMFVSPGDSSGKVIVIVSSGVVATLGMLLFLRIMHPPKLQGFSRIFPFIVVGIAGLSVVLGLVGPFRSQVASRNDRTIEDGLPAVNTAVAGYVSTNKKLPTTLQDIHVSGSAAQSLLDKSLVEYRVIQQPASLSPSVTNASGASIRSSTSTNPYDDVVEGKYELCVTYKQAKHTKYDDGISPPDSTTYISTYTHNAGRQCYTQTTNSF